MCARINAYENVTARTKLPQIFVVRQDDLKDLLREQQVSHIASHINRKRLRTFAYESGKEKIYI